MTAVCIAPSGEPAMRTSSPEIIAQWESWGFIVRYIQSGAAQ